MKFFAKEYFIEKIPKLNGEVEYLKEHIEIIYQNVKDYLETKGISLFDIDSPYVYTYMWSEDYLENNILHTKINHTLYLRWNSSNTQPLGRLKKLIFTAFKQFSINVWVFDDSYEDYKDFIRDHEPEAKLI
jgi:hypothetical protein